MIENNQLNYKIEKDLLKETYSNIYENISLTITIVLGIIGVFGFIGIRDITNIKKKYGDELSNLKGVQIKFQQKIEEFELQKSKFDNEIKLINQENQKQNEKIKFIELKAQISKLVEDNKLNDALELISVTLPMSPNDIDLLTIKARTLCRLNRLKDALKVHKELFKNNPENSAIATNLIENMIFANDLENAKKLISQFSVEFNDLAHGAVAKLMNIIALFHKNENDLMIKEIKSFINQDDLDAKIQRMPAWELDEAKYFAAHLKKSPTKEILQNLMWYLDGLISGKALQTLANNFVA
jgi:predicted Zn-dependent protease